MRVEKLYFGNTPQRNSDHQLSLGSTDFSDFRRPGPRPVLERGSQGDFLD